MNEPLANNSSAKLDGSGTTELMVNELPLSVKIKFNPEDFFHISMSFIVASAAAELAKSAP